MLAGGLFTQDLIVLKNGNTIEAKILEISPAEIRYKRFNHLEGPTIVVPSSDVLSMRYENGTVEIINALPAQGVSNLSPESAAAAAALGQPTPLQVLLNALPAIPVAGNNLQFQFGGDSWVTKLNGQNFSRGALGIEENAEGGLLMLRQTHIWPGAVGKAAGRVANLIPGGGTGPVFRMPPEMLRGCLGL